MHLPSLASHPQAEIRAICGRTRARAEAVAAKYRIGAIHSDHRALLDRGDLDAVVIATPDDTHPEIAMAALERGLHVLCEKPLANTLAAAEEIAAAAARVGVVHMTMFTWRSVPVWRRTQGRARRG